MVFMNISIYSLSDHGVSHNLIDSLSLSNWALFTPQGMNNARGIVEIALSVYTILF